MSDKKKLGVIGSVGVVVFFLIYSAVLYINLIFLEIIGKNVPLETEANENNSSSALNGYAWGGSIGWIIVIWVLAAVFKAFDTEDKINGFIWGGINIYYALTMLLILAICCNMEPYTDYREYKKGKDGLGAPQVYISCWTSSSSSNITIPVESTYITLTESEWQPSLNTSIIKTETKDGWDYVLSPILHNGPLKNCVIKPQIYAACIAKNTSGNEASVCGWGSTGMVTIRKIDASPYLEEFLKNRLPCASFPDLGSKYGWWNKNVIFEWNTITRNQMIEFIGSVDDDRDSKYKKITMGWFIATGVVTILCILFPDVMVGIAACCLAIFN
eukprot:TRINITY_DN874_c0_g1_i5.p1 TRINITY_DN874_c0_g1~~TRINITY_DN874_c0_g1_i5.p1  ORF type:complete len:349 (+),score=46.23 TRINITY_DN874_c0_g1_i5:63-1049(+)